MGVGLSGVISRLLCQLHVSNDRINDLVFTKKTGGKGLNRQYSQEHVCCVYLRPSSLECITCGRWIDIAQVRVT